MYLANMAENCTGKGLAYWVSNCSSLAPSLGVLYSCSSSSYRLQATLTCWQAVLDNGLQGKWKKSAKACNRNQDCAENDTIAKVLGQQRGSLSCNGLKRGAGKYLARSEEL